MSRKTLKSWRLPLEEMRNSGNVKQAVLDKYESIIGVYKEKMKVFRHKDQKPYWH